tara:strand:- start:11196 stop:11426 length:231 start_codon:yes stop_codon:yes gene_type:complete
MVDQKNNIERAKGGKTKRRWLIPLIFIPFFGVLWVPSYNTLEPELAGVPFFYWYQMAWILISAALTFAVYLLTEKE